jgi:hypothetical protein
MWTNKGSRSIFEDTIKVGTFKQLLPAEGNRKEALLQFWEPDERVAKGWIKGRLRTIAADDVVDVS